MAKYRFAQWLLLWLQNSAPFTFHWDEGNRTKSAIKHSVSITEEERFGIVGATSTGRILYVVFTFRENKIRPISTRPASKKERRFYEKYLLRQV